MPRTIDVSKLLTSLFGKIGEHVAEGIAYELKRSGLLSEIGKAAKVTRGPGKRLGRPAGKGNKKRLGARKGPRKGIAGKKCKTPGCDLPAKSKGLCSKHYQKARYHAMKGNKLAPTASKDGQPLRSRSKGKPAASLKTANKKPGRKLASMSKRSRAAFQTQPRKGPSRIRSEGKPGPKKITVVKTPVVRKYTKKAQKKAPARNTKPEVKVTPKTEVPF